MADTAGVRVRAKKPPAPGDQPSPDQLRFLAALKRERDIPLEVALEMSLKYPSPPATFQQAHELINLLKPLPRLKKARQIAEGTQREQVRGEIDAFLDINPPETAQGPLMREMRALLEKAAGVL